MSHYDKTSAIVDGLLKFLATGGLVTTSLLAPNAAQIFDKPIAKMLKGMDKRSQERELRRIAHYMKSRGLIAYDSRDYENGIKLTKAGKARLRQSEFDNITIPRPTRWDKKWRIIFFDIPIEKDKSRWVFTSRLRRLGLQPLQKSIWVHPYPCRAEIEAVSEEYGMRKYVTYVEVSEIDGADALKNRFKKLFTQKD